MHGFGQILSLRTLALLWHPFVIPACLRKSSEGCVAPCVLPRLLSARVVISLLPVYTSKNYLSWDATAELGYCAQRHSASVLDGSLLQRQFSINQIVTDCKALPFPEIVAGVVVCGHSDSDFRQADCTKRFNHTAH